MSMPASRLNALYQNAKFALENQASWTLRSYSSPTGLKINDELKAALFVEGVWSDEKFSELRTLLRITKTYNRALLAPNNGEQFWSEHYDKILSTLKPLKNYLPPQLVSSLEETLDTGKNGATDVTALHAAEVLRLVGGVEGRVLIVPERPKLGHLARGWISEIQLDESVHVLTDMADIRARLFDDYDLVLMPGSPTHYIFRPNFDIYLRALLFSGFARKVGFVSPSWATYKQDTHFAHKLLPGLTVSGIPELYIEADTSDSVDMDSAEQDLESEDLPNYVYKFGHFESFESGGDQECRLILLGGGRAYPVEEDAKRVSVFERNESTGEWRVTNKHPFKELEPGDILVANKDRSEKQANRDRAALEMGQSYFQFETAQAKWKGRLEAKLQEIGISNLEVTLRDAGVSKYGRVRHWLADEAIQPGVPRDFEITLRYLGFDQEEVSSVMALARKFDGHTSTAAKSASLAISKTLDEDDFLKLESGQAIEVHLDDFGDASYLLAPVQSITEIETLTKASQIRRVIRISED